MGFWIWGGLICSRHRFLGKNEKQEKGLNSTRKPPFSMKLVPDWKKWRDLSFWKVEVVCGEWEGWVFKRNSVFEKVEVVLKKVEVVWGMSLGDAFLATTSAGWKSGWRKSNSLYFLTQEKQRRKCFWETKQGMKGDNKNSVTSVPENPEFGLRYYCFAQKLDF